ncbi:MAG: HupE/UreJ family protein [Bacteroidetes bacterium]|jgi:hypothetical protein|nr:HupE/UreJ family protein [Bacteroidota bacterium]
MDFWSFLGMGWAHIIDFSAYDHILFITVLCALFKLTEWRKILVIVTAFTIGHSITLALSAFNIVFIPVKIVEILIPATIVITALSNILQKKQNLAKTFDRNVRKNYLIALLFGFIHGMGFASNFKFLLGDDQNIVAELLAFNLGIELGQLLIVLCILCTYFLLNRIFRIVHREWNLFLSGAGFGVGLILFFTNLLEK